MTQGEALSILKTGANVFLTGEPGSGKTHTVNQYVAYLREHGIEPAITASTGIAATHINGSTIHSWSGIGIKESLSDYDLDKISQNEKLVKRIRSATVLIIDEISMLSGRTLSLVDTVLRNVRGRGEPFGGMQVVLVGDFFQLPPIVKDNSAEEEIQLQLGGPEARGGRFAYESAAWKALNPFVCYLSEQHRQEDGQFLEILTALRTGKVGDEHRKLLNSRHSSAALGKSITKLFSHNINVDRINTDELGRLPGTARFFQATSTGSPYLVESLKRSCLSPAELWLKVGAKVMFTKNNFDAEFVNGTTGEIVEFRPGDGVPIVLTRDGEEIPAEPMEWAVESDGKVLARLVQVPLRLAWAITVHKSQGMSLDEAVVDLSEAFEYGQGYVALSRVRTLEGLYLLGLNDRALEVHPDILDKDDEFRDLSGQAVEAFQNIPEEEMAAMHEQFINACGGSVSLVPKEARFKKKKGSTYDVTKELLLKRMSLTEIAKERGLSADTILNHLEELAEKGKIEPERDLSHLCETDKVVISKIHSLFRERGHTPLKPVYEALDGRVPYDIIRIARLVFVE